MKKTFTLWILLFAFFAMNFVTIAAPNLKIKEGTEQVSGGVDDYLTIKGVVENVSSSQSVITKLKIYMENVQDGQSILVCWGDQCLPPIGQKGLTEFSEEVVLLPGENSAEKFHCDIDQGGVEGEMLITFVFYDKNNPTDSAAFTTHVIIGPTGVEISTPDDFNISPNPAANYINVNYINNAKEIHIYNILGALVKSVNVSEGTNNMNISLNGMPEGVYLVNVINRDGSIYSRKLVISR